MRTIVDMENSGVVHMLRHDKIQDLECMYKLLKRVQEGHKTMADCISKHLRAEGKGLVDGGGGGKESKEGAEAVPGMWKRDL